MKRAIPIILIIILLFLIKGLVSSLYTTLSGSGIVKNLEYEYQAKKKETKYLEERLYFVKSTEFIEKEAREKLGLVKEGEYVVLAPVPLEKKQQTMISDDTPNWKKWLNLFF